MVDSRHLMLSQKELMAAIRLDLALCRKAGRILPEGQDLETKRREIVVLLRYLQMTDEAGDEQLQLERIVKSLETHLLLGTHQHWREKATV